MLQPAGGNRPIVICLGDDPGHRFVTVSTPIVAEGAEIFPLGGQGDLVETQRGFTRELDPCAWLAVAAPSTPRATVRTVKTVRIIAALPCRGYVNAAIECCRESAGPSGGHPDAPSTRRVGVVRNRAVDDRDGAVNQGDCAARGRRVSLYTDNPEAYRWILRGRYFWNKGAGHAGISARRSESPDPWFRPDQGRPTLCRSGAAGRLDTLRPARPTPSSLVGMAGSLLAGCQHLTRRSGQLLGAVDLSRRKG